MLSLKSVAVLGIPAGLTTLAVCYAAPQREASKQQSQPEPIPNANIDYSGFVRAANEVAAYRKERRLTEEQFLAMAKTKDTLILDTRSAAAYEKLHVAGAVHLNFSDITKESLAKTIPSNQTRVLIYCNNNFRQEPKAFPTKMAPAALNIPTFITLYEYGYRNLYELGPVLDAKDCRLKLVSGKEPGEQSTSR